MQTKVIKVNPDFPEENLIKEAGLVLQKGGLVAFPTETVYGIGANLLNKDAINRLYELKKRPKDKPFSVHIAGLDELEKLELDLSIKVKKIMDKFWPGPLTIVAFNRKKEKIGVRMPKNKVANSLIKEAGVPLVAPSANISGEKPAISVEEIISKMDGLIDIILDGGPTEMGIESTVLDVTQEPFTILRQGVITKEELLADYHILFICAGNTCRSVMAKGLLEKFLKEAGLNEKVFVDSAGISTYKGISAAVNTIAVMKDEGIDVSLHRGRCVSIDLLKKADVIFVMEHSQRNIILSMMPEADLKIRVLKEDKDIPDPVGKSMEEYKEVSNIIKEEVENIFLELFKSEKSK